MARVVGWRSSPLWAVAKARDAVQVGVRQPLLQGLDQVPGEELFLVGGVGGVCTIARVLPEAARDVLAACPRPG